MGFISKKYEYAQYIKYENVMHSISILYKIVTF